MAIALILVGYVGMCIGIALIAEMAGRAFWPNVFLNLLISPAGGVLFLLVTAVYEQYREEKTR